MQSVAEAERSSRDKFGTLIMGIWRENQENRGNSQPNQLILMANPTGPLFLGREGRQGYLSRAIYAGYTSCPTLAAGEKMGVCTVPMVVWRGYMMDGTVRLVFH